MLLREYVHVLVCLCCVCVCACMRACVRALARACGRICDYLFVYVYDRLIVCVCGQRPERCAVRSLQRRK